MKFTSKDNYSEIIFSGAPRNELTPDDFAFLSDKIEGLRTNSTSKLLVLKSDDEEYFSNGLNLKSFENKSLSVLVEDFEKIIRGVLSVFSSPVPVVSILNGHTVGAAAIIAIMSDYRIMGKGARGRFGFPEVQLGLPFPTVAFSILTQIVPMPEAAHMVHSGKLLKFPEAGGFFTHSSTELAPEVLLEKLLREYKHLSIENITIVRQARQELYYNLLKQHEKTDAEQLAKAMCRIISDCAEKNLL